MISHECSVKRTVESCLSIDVRQWARAGVLNSTQPFYMKILMPDGELHVVMTILPEPTQVRIDHHLERETVSQTVLLDHTPCNMGGQRTWLKCPECKARVAKLFIVDDKLLCRACGHLGNRSQVESPSQRRRRKEAALRSRLDPYLGKPSGMRFRTYGKVLKALANIINGKNAIEVG